MSDPREQERWLACGRPASALVDLVAEPDRADPELAEHARGCRYCGSELAALQRQWNAVRQAAATPVSPPDGLVSRALETVRGIRGGGSEPLELAQPEARQGCQSGGRRPLAPRRRQEPVPQRGRLALAGPQADLSQGGRVSLGYRQRPARARLQPLVLPPDESQRRRLVAGGRHGGDERNQRVVRRPDDAGHVLFVEGPQCERPRLHSDGQQRHSPQHDKKQEGPPPYPENGPSFSL